MSTTRRSFLKTSGLLGGGFAALSAGWPTRALASAVRADLPYYLTGAPFTGSIRSGSGENILLQGKVFQPDGKTPLAGALVEIWQADAQGRFDWSSSYGYRGKTRADAQGNYRMQTHLPGKHAEKGRLQTRNIFLLVQAPGFRDSFAQLYLTAQGRPFVDSRLWANCPIAQRPTLPRLVEGKSEKHIQFDLYPARKERLFSGNGTEWAASQVLLYSDHRRRASFLQFNEVRPGPVSIQVFNRKGRLMAQHRFGSTSGSTIMLPHAQLTQGRYTCLVQTGRYGCLQKHFDVA
jgi:protocatechuate 3,4-dioxygenase beta subunit